jgi:hypothetical protein
MYTLHIKSAKHLAVNVVINANGNVSDADATLLAGDADNNNIVDVDDLARLIESFDADPSFPNWLGGIADFDGDQVVTVDDLSLFIQNFDASGAD